MWSDVLSIVWFCIAVAVALGILLKWLWDYFFGRKSAADASVDVASLEARLKAAREECESCAKSRKELETRIGDLEGSLVSSRSRTAELENRLRLLESEKSATVATALVAETAPSVATAPVAAAAGGAATWASLATSIEHDNLEDIHGIGPKLATLLHSLGIHTFRQIALWSEADIDQVDAKLEEFKGRIRRENWVQSARECHWRKYNEALAGYIPGTGKATPTE